MVVQIIVGILSLIFGFFTETRRKTLLLDEFNITEKMTVADYGCGFESRILKRISEIVGTLGEVYAIDINPFVGVQVQDIILHNNLSNVKFAFPSADVVNKTNKFDVVYSILVLYLVEEGITGQTFRMGTQITTCQFFENIHRIVKPTGFFYLVPGTKNADSLIGECGLFEIVLKFKKFGFDVWKLKPIK